MEKLFLTLVLLSSWSLLVSSYKYKVPAIFTFGDSIVDAGNNHFNKNCSAQADFPPYGSTFFHHPTGRFTNGRTVVDFISQFLGIEFQKPYLEAKQAVVNGSRKDYPSNGINFASAGSGVLRQTNQDLGVIPIQEQLQQFQTLVNQNQIDKNLIEKSIFFLESGSNDIFNYFIPFGSPKLDPETYVQAMLIEAANFIDKIYKFGARRIAVFSLGPVGCIPARALLPGSPINKCYGKMNVMVKKYNKGLEMLVKEMASKYPGAIGVYGAVYDVVQRFRAIPTRYGGDFVVTVTLFYL
ncbi:GDSL esterase/lipase 6 isoform X2 [Jatropha curcas]|uniref:GDSL esterase/lipase 6 isoform X2 n=1 Tax=Jatropha curcas TaxID=180498 RepID=UPI0018958670|nr:GDSL esterase/lipase 6 isoform X2 [Jatropha curcas]